ncbi:MAG TPA: universal stress protein [Acidobacteriota bacterium]|nr:universal stress protein [Acidobacteriota bacterium]
MEVQNILFPTDFSESAERALPHALELSRRFGGKVTILHVRTPFGDDTSSPEFQFFDQGKYEVFVEKQLEELPEVIDASEFVDTAMARNISAASGILEFADDHEIDMVVMGTHGRSALAQFFLGSVAEKVVRHASCPVLTVADHRGGYRSRPEYQKIMAAFDFSRASKDAVRRGQQFAQAYQADLEVFYVVEQIVLPPFDKFWKASVRSELPEVVSSARSAVTDALGEEALGTFNLNVQVGDADGKAEREIVERAREKELDLIIMGTHGLTGLDHALLGSTTERVVRTAPCPVLTFHGPKD